MPADATCSAFLRLFLNRMEPSTQEAHYEEIMGRHAEQQAAGIRDWVEGSVQDVMVAAAVAAGGSDQGVKEQPGQKRAS